METPGLASSDPGSAMPASWPSNARTRVHFAVSFCTPSSTCLQVPAASLPSSLPLPFPSLFRPSLYLWVGRQHGWADMPAMPLPSAYISTTTTTRDRRDRRETFSLPSLPFCLAYFLFLSAAILSGLGHGCILPFCTSFQPFLQQDCTVALPSPTWDRTLPQLPVFALCCPSALFPSLPPHSPFSFLLACLLLPLPFSCTASSSPSSNTFPPSTTPPPPSPLPGSGTGQAFSLSDPLTSGSSHIPLILSTYLKRKATKSGAG